MKGVLIFPIIGVMILLVGCSINNDQREIQTSVQWITNDELTLRLTEFLDMEYSRVNLVEYSTEYIPSPHGISTLDTIEYLRSGENYFKTLHSADGKRLLLSSQINELPVDSHELLYGEINKVDLSRVLGIKMDSDSIIISNREQSDIHTLIFVKDRLTRWRSEIYPD